MSVNYTSRMTGPGIQRVFANTHNLNRVIRAQITNVDGPHGYVTYTYDGLPGGGHSVTVEPLWMSFPRNGKGAWGRFMPQVDDMIKIGFMPDDTAKMLGYDIEAGQPEVDTGNVGWPAIHEQYEKCQSGGNDARPQYANFVPLKEGEYDFMSSGGSYIHGSDTGRLYMSGGPVSIVLTKDELKLQTNAQYHKSMAENSTIRFGQVRRQKNGTEEAVGNGSMREFGVEVAGTTTLASFKLGNAVDEAAVTSKKGQPVRALLRAYGDTSDKKLEMQIDSVGNMVLDAAAGEFISEFTAYKMTASSSFTIASPTIKLGGDSSSNPLLLTSVYGPAEQQVITQLAAQISQLATQVSLLSAAIATYAAAEAIAYPPLSAADTALSGVATTVGSISGTVATTAPTVATTFTSVYNDYLSKVSKTS